MKKSFRNFCLLFILIIFVFMGVVNAQELNFTDIENHWAKENVEKLVANSIVTGYPDGKFKPENNVTVNEFIKMVVAAGEYTLVREGSNIYPDFYIATAKKQQIIDDEFTDFDKCLTRYEMVEIISNFIGIEDVKINKNIFTDLDKANKDKVLKLVGLKIINGYEDKTFRGEKSITRAEAVTVICRALEVRDMLIVKRKYKVEEEPNLSNYINVTIDSENNKNSSIKTFYEIKDNKIKIFDNGRYASLKDYEISSKNINVNKVIKIIRKIVNEKAYLGVIYVPSKYTINELKILYGSEEQKVLCGEYDFAFNYYENKNYELSNKSLHQEFSNNCYMRIDVIKLWDDYSDYKNGVYVDEYKKEKLLDALKIEFGSASSKILDYMIDKNIKYVTNVECDKEHVEQKVFGNYIINYYQKEYGVPQFYIERK